MRQAVVGEDATHDRGIGLDDLKMRDPPRLAVAILELRHSTIAERHRAAGIAVATEGLLL